MGTVLHVADGQRMAGTAFLSALEVFGRPHFLKERAYPFLKDVATYLEQISTVDADGVRRLPLSSSPEIFDNSINAWFKDMTNYDLSLMHFAFNAASELASELGLADEDAHWKAIGAQLPDLNLDEDRALTFAKGLSLIHI